MTDSTISSSDAPVTEAYRPMGLDEGRVLADAHRIGAYEISREWVRPPAFGSWRGATPRGAGCCCRSCA